LNSDVDVISLPSSSDFIKPGKMCWTAGWGKTGKNNPLSVTLREVELRIMDQEACKDHSDYDYQLQVCAGSPTTSKSIGQVSTHLLFLPTSGNSIRRGSVSNSSPRQ
jgi:hypothetical protein